MAKIKLKIINDNPVGWSITGETEEEKNIINSIRNLSFFGFDDTAIKYNGRTNSSEKYAGTLHWIQKKYQNATPNTMFDDIKHKGQIDIEDDVAIGSEDFKV